MNRGNFAAIGCRQLLSTAGDNRKTEIPVTQPDSYSDGCLEILLRDVAYGSDLTVQLTNPMMIPLRAEPCPAQAKWIPAGRPKPRPALKPPKSGTIGFRNDQSGRFPDARPVFAFDLKKGINVPWRVPLRVNNGAPLAVKDKVFTAFGRAFVGAPAATRLILVDRDTVHAETLWKRDGYSLYGCWVLCDGIAWGFEKNVRSFDFLTALPRGHVEHVFAYSTGHNYAPPALAGDVLLVADDERSGHNNMANWSNATFPDKPKLTPLPSCLSAVLPGPEPLVLARSASEGITMGLGFGGDHWFVRSRKSIFCVAYTGEDGKRYEAEVVAKTLPDQMQFTMPDDSEPVNPPALRELPKEFEPARLRIELPMTHWNLLGPVAAEDETKVDVKAERERRLARLRHARPHFQHAVRKVPAAEVTAPVEKLLGEVSTKN